MTRPLEDEDDKPLPEDAEIAAVFPTRSGRHDLYQEAMRLVGAKHSKAELVNLVNWLLHRIWKGNTQYQAEYQAASAQQELLAECYPVIVNCEERLPPYIKSTLGSRVAAALPKSPNAKQVVDEDEGLDPDCPACREELKTQPEPV